MGQVFVPNAKPKKGEGKYPVKAFNRLCGLDVFAAAHGAVTDAAFEKSFPPPHRSDLKAVLESIAQKQEVGSRGG